MKKMTARVILMAIVSTLITIGALSPFADVLLMVLLVLVVCWFIAYLIIQAFDGE